MMPPLPDGWKPELAGELDKPYFRTLQQFLAEERHTHTVYPPEQEEFAALGVP